jgi:hypothetical protein
MARVAMYVPEIRVRPLGFARELFSFLHPARITYLAGPRRIIRRPPLVWVRRVTISGISAFEQTGHEPTSPNDRG